MTDLEIAQVRSRYISEIVDIVESLHQSGIAHLDIRNDNICHDKDGLVLIDLERYEDASESAMVVTKIYHGSDLYVAGGEDWNCCQLDWKQVGLLFCELSFGNKADPFISKLIEDGEMH